MNKVQKVERAGPKNGCVQNHELYNIYFDLCSDFVNKLQKVEFMFIRWW